MGRQYTVNVLWWGLWIIFWICSVLYDKTFVVVSAIFRKNKVYVERARIVLTKNTSFQASHIELRWSQNDVNQNIMEQLEKKCPLILKLMIQNR